MEPLFGPVDRRRPPGGLGARPKIIGHPEPPGAAARVPADRTGSRTGAPQTFGAESVSGRPADHRYCLPRGGKGRGDQRQLPGCFTVRPGMVLTQAQPLQGDRGPAWSTK